mmetsp:Transcript_17735/g.29893  ORF Transcript_17735/g.29893 Transcript_17735/m.29893 type:complete len:368 (+) Transcript_17735:39-1142(+)
MAKNKKTSNLKGKSEASTELAASPVLMQGNRPEVDATSSAVAQQKTADNGGIMQRILSSENYALALAPGFYRFYAHIGILLAFEEAGCLRHTHVTGSSAGALVGGFLASGMKPSEMVSPVLGIKRADIWDMGGFGGLLKGELFESLIAANIPVQTFEECSVPLGVTTYDVFGFQTNVITNGNIARAVRTSCTFPGMFQPVYWDGHPHIDGGVWDHAGLMALPETMKRKPSPTTTTSNITKTASLSSSSSSSSAAAAASSSLSSSASSSSSLQLLSHGFAFRSLANTTTATDIGICIATSSTTLSRMKGRWIGTTAAKFTYSSTTTTTTTASTTTSTTTTSTTTTGGSNIITVELLNICRLELFHHIR